MKTAVIMFVVIPLDFRSDVEFKEKKSDKRRILFFGDSNTAADGVSNNEKIFRISRKTF